MDLKGALVGGLPLQVHLLQGLPRLIHAQPPHDLFQRARGPPERRGHLADGLGVELAPGASSTPAHDVGCPKR